ncbi:MAG: hypothetical protein FJ083_15420 [Cyanobacteria bacterium K_Offshore_surface_m2_239]|nr:hypothetical protein [Cyanobacteria bacterium K_Offshore_surface_m2_239]
MAAHFLVLIDRQQRQLRVPVKAMIHPVTHAILPCGGMPQLFGGDCPAGSTAAILLRQSVQDLSRRTLAMTADVWMRYYSLNGSNFYWAHQEHWQVTGLPWSAPESAAALEISTIATVDLSRFAYRNSDAEILQILYQQTGSGTAPPQARLEFEQTPLPTAFVRLIRMAAAGQV